MSDALSHASSKFVNSFVNVSERATPARAAMLQLVKEPAMRRDMLNFYLVEQVVAPSVAGTGTLEIYGPIGSRVTLDTTPINHELNAIKTGQGTYCFEISLVEVALNTDPEPFVAAGPIGSDGRSRPQTFFIRMTNVGQSWPYHWAITPNTNDKGHQVHYYFGDNFPNQLQLEYGHVQVLPNQVTSFLDFNSQTPAVPPVNTQPVYFNQQASLITFRFLIKTIHIGF